MRWGKVGVLAVCALLATAAVATSGQAQDQPPRHTDHDRAEPSEQVLLATAQGMVDAGTRALEATLAGEDRQAGLEQANRSAQLATSLEQASRVETSNVSLQPLLATLGPVGDRLGPSLANLTADGYTLLHDDQAPTMARTLAWINVTQDLPRARAQVDALAEEDVATEALSQALDAYEARFQAVPEPAGVGARLSPQPAYLGQTVHLTIYQPGEGQAEATVEAFGEEQRARLDEQGLAEARLRVPWEAETGTHEVTISGANSTLELTLAVERVPTEWREVRAGPPGPDRALRAQLVDHADEGVPRAPVQAAIGGQAGDPLTNRTTTTSPGGLARVPLEANETGVRLTFAPNRTHEGAEIVWEDPWLDRGQRTATQDEGPELDALFEQVGQSEPPEAPPTRWALAGAILAATLAVLAFEVDQAVWRLQAHGRGLEGWLLGHRPPTGEAGRAPVTSVAGLPAHHPVVYALSLVGYDPDRLTLRQAAEILEGMGAPEVQLWAVQHERAYYTDRPAPPVPPSLQEWVEDLP